MKPSMAATDAIRQMKTSRYGHLLENIRSHRGVLLVFKDDCGANVYACLRAK